MTRLARHTDERESDEGGWSIVEAMITIAITMVAMAMVLPTVAVALSITESSAGTANAGTSVRSFMQLATFEIGSTNSDNICFPAAATAGVSDTCPPSKSTNGSTIRILTDAAGHCRWVQFTENTKKQLTEQTWKTTWTTAQGTPATVVEATGVENNPSSQPIFTLDTSNLVVHVQLELGGFGSAATRNSRAAVTTDRASAFMQTSVQVVSSNEPAGSC